MLPVVLVDSFPAGDFAANCYLLATAEGSPGVVVDPGDGAWEPLQQLCAQRSVTPVAVLATHGHLDHIRDIAQVCQHWDIPAYIHPADRELLTEPERGLPPEWAPMVAAVLGGHVLVEPDEVLSYPDGAFSVAGLTVTATHTPGHSAGSVMIQVGHESESVIMAGDVIFAGAIGRTDLPGSDPAAMQRSLQWAVANLPADAPLLPGHGPRSSMAREVVHNPYLPSSA